MLLRIFKTSQPISWILIILIISALRTLLFTLFYNESYIIDNTSLTSSFTQQFSISLPWVSHYVSLLIILFSGFFFNKITQNINLFKGIHSLIVLFFGLLLSFNPENLVLTPFLISIPFSLYSLNLLLTQSKGNVSLQDVFNASFSIGISTLIYFPAIVLIPISLTSLAYLNQAQWRSFLITFIGFLTPFLFSDTIIYSLILNQPLFYNTWTSNISTLNLTNYGSFYASTTLLGLLLIQLLVYLKAASKSIIKIRKSLYLMFYYLIIGVLMAGFLTTNHPNLINLIVFPGAIVLTEFQVEAKKWWLKDLLFLGLLAAFGLSYLGI